MSRPVLITEAETFAIDLPCSPAEIAAGAYHRYVVTRVRTDAGVTGYSFAGPPRQWWGRVRDCLTGQDLFAVDRHLAAGLADCFGAEHAVWDAIGKLLGRPVYDLLGGARRRRVPVYLTLVWPGPADQHQLTPRELADAITAYQQQGYPAVKIRAWLPEPTANGRRCQQVRELVGPGVTLMVDRTAHLSGHTWTYDEALRAGHALQEAEVAWLEEPMDRADLAGHARLAAALDLPVVGGEGYRTPAEFGAALRDGAYDAIQPDAGVVGGILPSVRVAALAGAAAVPVIPHGQGGLRLAGWLQVAALVGAPWQELAIMPPPLLPSQAWSPALAVLDQDELFRIEAGQIEVPDRPGLGLNVNDRAVQCYRVG